MKRGCYQEGALHQIISALFARPFFLLFSCPHRPHSFRIPPLPGTSKLLRFQEETQHSGAGVRRGFWKGVTTQKKEGISLKNGAQKLVRNNFSRKHPSRDVIFSGRNLPPKMPKNSSLHDVLEPLKQALLASCDVLISSQICVSKLQRVFTLGDGCWLPIIL